MQTNLGSRVWEQRLWFLVCDIIQGQFIMLTWSAWRDQILRGEHAALLCTNGDEMIKRCICLQGISWKSSMLHTIRHLFYKSIFWCVHRYMDTKNSKRCNKQMVETQSWTEPNFSIRSIIPLGYKYECMHICVPLPPLQFIWRTSTCKCVWLHPIWCAFICICFGFRAMYPKSCLFTSILVVLETHFHFFLYHSYLNRRLWCA